MPSEKDLILAKLARDHKFLTDEHIQECIGRLMRRRKDEPGLTLTRLLIEMDFLTTSQLERLEKIRIEQKKERLIEGFEILGLVGQGAMGAVYRANQIRMNRPVALKVLAASVVRDERFLSRFQREAETTGRLSHPNIVQGIDVGECQGVYYFAMEFVDGESLSKVLERKRYSEHESIELMLQLAKALDHLYDHGLVHRDVKPENVMITRKGQAKLADLGLAKAVEEDSRVTMVGTIVGTPLYMSPEQARGETDIDIRSDLYSLGITFWHMVTGQAPFDGLPPTVIMTKHITEDIPSIRDVDPSLSQEVERVVRRMCQREKDRRYQTPRELIPDLEYLLGGSMPLESSSFLTVQREATPPAVTPIRPEPAPEPPPRAPAPIRGETSRRRAVEKPAEKPPEKGRTKVRDREPPPFKFCHVPSEKEVYFALIVLKNQLVGRDQLARALDQQEEMAEMGFPRPLDEVLVEKRFLSVKHRDKILQAQKDTRRKDREALFGRVAVELELVSKEQVRKALKTQGDLRQKGKDVRLGEILIKQGALSFHDKIQVLSEQIRVNCERDERRFGTLALEAGMISELQLGRALETQARSDPGARPKIGDVLVGMGALSENQKSALLRAQRRQEILGGDFAAYMRERRTDLPEIEDLEDSGSTSTSFGNLRLKRSVLEHCPFCGEETDVSRGICRACGKPLA